MKTKTNQSLLSIFEDWRAEDKELEACIDEVGDWMNEVNQLGRPHFGETATRLRPLRERLLVHFQREDEMVSQLSTVYAPKSPEIEAVARQAAQDHKQLLGRLDDLIARLERTDPPFDSWEQAMHQVELFVSELEQHEDRESESFSALIPATDATS